ncbi:amino acid permease-domain-containing protein [Podospora australis]|uniref:Amino acid permease-domain-containing protein n=1 Tax=Podospora australis TaxID=1536484 RepID=A0AAN6WU11_9PEZI|nr:amino acid permease-domain-containing protein [Podospora australis]
MSITSMKNDSLVDEDEPSRPIRRWLESFRRDPGRRITPVSVVHSIEESNRASLILANGGGFYGSHSSASDRMSALSNPSVIIQGVPPGTREGYGRHYFDLHAANVNTANSQLSRELKGRHLQMIAIGGSIGTGLFVASGQSLTAGGPASLLIAYSFVGVMLYCTCQALGELAVAFPVAGSFSAYSTRFIDPAWGFAMGWNYALQWLIVLPLELIAASLTAGYWNTTHSRAIYVTIFLATIVIINLFSVKTYGEAEFIFSIIKIIAVIGFILLGIVINIGGFPDEGYMGGRFWQHPGAFNNGFKGLCCVFVTAAFAFTGTELVGLAAAETVNPRKSIPRAIKQVFWRISLFYIVSLGLIGLLVPYNHPDLLGPESVADASSSPFVIAIESAGISILPGVMNSVILVAVISVGNSAVFGSSRTLAALADQRQAPRILGYVDRRGRPLAAIIASSFFGLLGYLADLEHQTHVLQWLLAVGGLSSIFTWASICLAHIRFRRAWAAKGRSLSQLTFRSQAGVLGSYIGLISNLLVLIAQLWTAAWPIPPTFPDPKDLPPHEAADLVTGNKMPTDFTNNGIGVMIESPRDIVHNFFLQYLCAPIVITMYFGYKFWYRTKIVKIEEIDLDTGRRRNLPILILEREEEEKKAWPRWKRVYKFLC